MKQSITLSINPTYLCNFSCQFCYLTPEQLKDPRKIELKVLENRLKEISNHRSISHIDLYGGEIGILPSSYTKSLLNIIRKYYDGEIYLSTNLSKLSEILDDSMVYPTISWDYKAREKYDKVLENIRALKRKFSIQMLVTEEMRTWTENDLVFINQTLNGLDHLVSFELKPYSKNQSNQFENLEELYISFVKKFMIMEKKYSFINQINIESSLNRMRNPFSDDHLYIQPNGAFAVLDFDENDNEYFKEIASYEAYLEWHLSEKVTFIKHRYCNECDYFGNCLSEHLRPSEGKDGHCSGFKELLDWYADRP